MGLEWVRGKSGFPDRGGRITIESVNALKEDPLKMLRLFQVAQYEKFDIHPRAMRMISQNLKLIERDFRKTSQQIAYF